MNLRSTTLAFAAAATFAVVGCDSEEDATVDNADVAVVEQPAPAPEPAPEPVFEQPAPVPERAAEPEADAYVDPADVLMPDEERYRNSAGEVDWSAVPASEIDGFDDADGNF